MMLSRWKRLRAILEFRPPDRLPAGCDEAAVRLLHARHLYAYRWALPYVAGKRTLEIGVNAGYGLTVLAQAADQPVGVDLCFELVQRAKRSSGVPVLQANGQSLPLADASIEVVVSFQVIEHVWDDAQFLNEIDRVLRPGGLLLISTPNRDSRLLPRQMPWNSEHLREYDPRSCCSLLERVFADIEIYGLYGKKLADRVEKIRVYQDPWNHFLPARLTRPLRGLGRRVHRLLSKPMEVNDEDVRAVSTDNDTNLMEHFFLDREPDRAALDLYAVCRKAQRGQRNSADFDGMAYWKRRHSAFEGLEAVGTLGAPVDWQKWLYRGKVAGIERLLTRQGVDPTGGNILDFGCGTGYFETYWETRRAASVSGIDIVGPVVAELQKAFSCRHYLAADLAHSPSALGQLPVSDLTTAIDVIYHIVDDRQLDRTLGALSGQLRSNGWFLFTDTLWDGRPDGAAHVRWRSLNQWRQMLERHGLEIVDKEPLFIFQNRISPLVVKMPHLMGCVQYLADRLALKVAPWAASLWVVLARKSASCMARSQRYTAV